MTKETKVVAPKYRVIYIDPPWFYNEPAFRKAGKPQGEANIKYPCMKLPELKRFGKYIDEWAAKDCAMFMWVTSPRLDWAMELGAAWGFRWCTVAFFWIKIKEKPEQQLMFPTVEGLFHSAMLEGSVRKGMGFHTSQQMEWCLLWKRGKPGAFEVRMEDQVRFQPIREHSRKPDCFRETIERAYPKGGRIEVFARERCVGWDTFGNEVDKFKKVYNSLFDNRRNVKKARKK
jgi:N6-adenosine-specific RNA methylase IME4